MNNFRKIISCVLAMLLAVAPFMVFATDDVDIDNFSIDEGSAPTLVAGEVVGEDFSGAEDGIDYWDVSEFIDGNSDLFASYRAHTTRAVWYKATGDTQSKGHCGIINAETEEIFRTTKADGAPSQFAIHDNATSSVTDEAFTVTKVKQSEVGFNHFFELKYPIVSGLQRFSFEVNFSHVPNSWAQNVISFYDTMPTEGQAQPSTSRPISFAFNGNNFYCYTNTDTTWNTANTRGGSIVAGQTMAIDILIDADNNTATFFVNDKFIRTASYTANDPQVLGILDGATGSWLNSAGAPFVFKYDNFEQEIIEGDATYDFNILDGAEGVLVDEAPLFTFNTPVEKAVADSIKVYKNGSEIVVDRFLSEDGLEISFDLELEYGTQYKFSMPAGYARNKLAFDAQDFIFDTEKFIINVGDKFVEDFSSIPDGAEYYSLHKYMAERAKDDDAIFSRYSAHVNILAAQNGKEVQPAVTTQEIEDYLRTYIYKEHDNVGGIVDEVTARVQDGRFRLSKSFPKSQKITFYHGFNLKHPITEGVYRIGFELESETAITEWSNHFVKLLGDEIHDDWYGSTPTAPDTNAKTLLQAALIGFNGSNMFFSSNYNAEGKAEDWQIQPAEKLAKGIYQIDIIIDADNKRISFFSNGTHIRSTGYNADAIRAIAINDGRLVAYTASGGGEAVFHFDNFVQERLASPSYEFNIADGSYGVATSTKPTVTFGTPIDEAAALRIEAYEDGVLLDVDKTLSQDGTEVTLNMPMKNSAEYKIVVPKGLFAMNNAPITEGECTFRTAHKNLGIRLVVEYKSTYEKDTPTTARATLTNKSGASAPVIYIAALYDADGKMIDIDYTAVTLDRNAQNVPVTVTLPASSETSATVKTFLIDGFKSMYPVITDK